MEKTNMSMVNDEKKDTIIKEIVPTPPPSSSPQQDLSTSTSTSTAETVASVVVNDNDDADELSHELSHVNIKSTVDFSPTLVDPIHKQQYEQLKRLYPVGKPVSNYYHFTPGFSKDEIDYILKDYENYPLVEGLVGDTIDKTYRNSDIKWIPRTENTEWLYRKMFQMAIWCQDQYGFNLWCMGEQIQIARYEPKLDDNGNEVGGFYDWHCDHGSGVSSLRRLSLSTQLSDPSEYVGGELQLKYNRDTITAPKTQGTVVAFPSYMLHRVMPVTKGVRYSLVNWISGPPIY